MRDCIITVLCVIFVFACGGDGQKGLSPVSVQPGGTSISPASVRSQVESRCLDSRSDSFCVQAYAVIAQWTSGEITDEQFVNRIVELQSNEVSPVTGAEDVNPYGCSGETLEFDYQQGLFITINEDDGTDEERISFTRIGNNTGLNAVRRRACLDFSQERQTKTATGLIGGGRGTEAFRLYSYGTLPVQCVWDFDDHHGPLNYPCISSGRRAGTNDYETRYGRDCADNIREPLLQPDFAFLAYIENNEFHLDDCRRGGKEDCIDTINRIWPPVPGERGSCPDLRVAERHYGNTPRPAAPVNIQVTSTVTEGVSGLPQGYDFVETIRVTWERAEGADYTVLSVSRHGEVVLSSTVIAETEYSVSAIDEDLVQFVFSGYVGEPQDVGKDSLIVSGLRGNFWKSLTYTAGNPGRITSFKEHCISSWRGWIDPRCEFRERDLPLP